MNIHQGPELVIIIMINAIYYALMCNPAYSSNLFLCYCCVCACRILIRITGIYSEQGTGCLNSCLLSTYSVVGLNTHSPKWRRGGEELREPE